MARSAPGQPDTMRLLSAVLLIVLLVVAPLAGARPHETRMSLEGDESRRNDHEAMGQFNCVAAAASGSPEGRCAPVETGASHPAMGTLVLDAFFETHGGIRSPGALLEDPRANRVSYYEGTNLHRSTDGAAPDILLPGAHDVWAWFGYWNDGDVDGYAEYKTVPTNSANPFDSESISPANEWVRRDGARVVAFIEPGSHPQFGSATRPASYEPDLVLAPATAGNPLYESQDTFVMIHVDGSLLSPVELRVVTDPRFDHAPGAASYVDIDDHPAVAPGSIVPLYTSTAAPLVNALGSPSLGYTPHGGRLGPVPLDDTPAREPSREIYETFWARYGREWAPGSRSTSEGRHADHVADYEPWIDLLAYHSAVGPAMSTAYTGPGPMPGRANDGDAAAAPGFVSFDLWIGVWKDLNEDGYVGHAKPGDAHEGGSRPMADSYAGSNGEWLGVNPGVRPGGGGWRITLTPERDWGLAGVFVMRNADVFTIANARGDVCPAPVGCLPNGGARHITGETPIEIEVRAFGNGRLASDYVLFPSGSFGIPFTACTEPIPVATDKTAEPKSGVVHDCDAIDALFSPDVNAVLPLSYPV